MLYVIAIIISAFIWYVNASWGNFFDTCFILSTTTFLIIIVPFEIYFSIRDIWFDRWIHLEIEDADVSEISIDVHTGQLQADLIKPKTTKNIRTKKALVLIVHGFSDTKEDLQYFYLPLALRGYTILAYDARGTGGSKDAGKRSQFEMRIDDFIEVLDWIQSNLELRELTLFCLGFSIGALTILCGGLQRTDVKKLIAISSIADYKESISTHNPIIKFSYSIKGVVLDPDDTLNESISPIRVMERLKNNLTKQEWNQIAQKVWLIHARNDKIIKFQNFIKNKKILSLPDEKAIVFEKGGHSHKKNELALVGSVLQILDTL